VNARSILARFFRYLPLGASAIPLPTSSPVMQGQASPDGRWMAYVCAEAQRSEVYVASFPGPGAKRQISMAGGTHPHWRGDGKEIFFVAPDNQLMAAEVTLTGNTLRSGAVRSLFGLSGLSGGYSGGYDVSPDGQRVLAAVPAEQGTTPRQPLTVVQNWTAALKK
jgi:eukaryotic-like serine/threonine-protein kinase